LLVKIVLQCHDLPGQHLFEYQDPQGKVHAVSSADVNEYIRHPAHGDFTAKNFRTWNGTVLAVMAFEKNPPIEGKKGIGPQLSQVISQVALQLRNTPATCRKYYIHPSIISAVEDGSFLKAIKLARHYSRSRTIPGLSPDETAAFYFLKHSPLPKS
jgi:DNA topoisomerase I